MAILEEGNVDNYQQLVANGPLISDDGSIKTKIDKFDVEDDNLSSTMEYWNSSVINFWQEVENLLNMDNYPDENNLEDRRDAGNAFKNNSSTNPYVKPNQNWIKEKYLEARADEIEDVLQDDSHLDFTIVNTDKNEDGEKDYLDVDKLSDDLKKIITRLLMPQFKRGVEVEDLDRNFWVIGQNLTTLNKFFLSLSDIFADNIIAELMGLWDNVYRIWQAIQGLIDNFLDKINNEKWSDEKVHVIMRYDEQISDHFHNFSIKDSSGTSHNFSYLPYNEYIETLLTNHTDNESLQVAMIDDGLVMLEHTGYHRDIKEVLNSIREKNFILICGTNSPSSSTIWDLLSYTSTTSLQTNFGSDITYTTYIKSNKAQHIWIDFVSDNFSKGQIASYTELNKGDLYNKLSYDINLTIPIYRNWDSSSNDYEKYSDFIRINKPYPNLTKVTWGSTSETINDHIESLNDEDNWFTAAIDWDEIEFEKGEFSGKYVNNGTKNPSAPEWEYNPDTITDDLWIDDSPQTILTSPTINNDGIVTNEGGRYLKDADGLWFTLNGKSTLIEKFSVAVTKETGSFKIYEEGKTTGDAATISWWKNNYTYSLGGKTLSVTRTKDYTTTYEYEEENDKIKTNADILLNYVDGFWGNNFSSYLATYEEKIENYSLHSIDLESEKGISFGTKQGTYSKATDDDGNEIEYISPSLNEITTSLLSDEGEKIANSELDSDPDPSILDYYSYFTDKTNKKYQLPYSDKIITGDSKMTFSYNIDTNEVNTSGSNTAIEMTNLFPSHIASSDLIDCTHATEGQTKYDNKYGYTPDPVINLRYINGRKYDSQEIEIVTTKDKIEKPIRYNPIINFNNIDIGTVIDYDFGGDKTGELNNTYLILNGSSNSNYKMDADDVNKIKSCVYVSTITNEDEEEYISEPVNYSNSFCIKIPSTSSYLNNADGIYTFKAGTLWDNSVIKEEIESYIKSKFDVNSMQERQFEMVLGNITYNAWLKDDGLFYNNSKYYKLITTGTNWLYVFVVYKYNNELHLQKLCNLNKAYNFFHGSEFREADGGSNYAYAIYTGNPDTDENISHYIVGSCFLNMTNLQGQSFKKGKFSFTTANINFGVNASGVVYEIAGELKNNEGEGNFNFTECIQNTPQKSYIYGKSSESNHYSHSNQLYKGVPGTLDDNGVTKYGVVVSEVTGKTVCDEDGKNFLSPFNEKESLITPYPS